MKYKNIIQNILKTADISTDGNRPWDIRVHNDDFYRRVVSRGALGLGESYMDGSWDAEKPEEFISHLLRTDARKEVFNWRNILTLGPTALWTYLVDFGKKGMSYNIGKHHYDVGNDVYRAMLDKRMVYTCGYFKDTDDLDEAQEAKLDLICRKVGLKPGMRVLDIGCGWGSFLKFAAEKYGIVGVGVTVSQNQVDMGNKLCEGLPVEIKYMDYRDVEGTFDRIISIGMFEHVGPKHYKEYMKKVSDLLSDDGLFLLHTIGGNRNRRVTDPWINKYIFPGGVIPSMPQISIAAQKCFVMEDWHNFGYDYYRTLIAWRDNFNAHWKDLKESGSYDDKFYRMWNYYLNSTAGAFKARHIHLWQIVFSKKGLEEGYRSIR